MFTSAARGDTIQHSGYCMTFLGIATDKQSRSLSMGLLGLQVTNGLLVDGQINKELIDSAQKPYKARTFVTQVSRIFQRTLALCRNTGRPS